MDRRDGGALAEKVTTYLLNTTELRPRPSVHAVWAIMNGAVLVGCQPKHRPDAECLVMSTGSVAELYIEPLAPCFGDYDTMYHFNDMLAIPSGHPLPLRMPEEFHQDVNVYEIADSHIPGYVYLVLRYQLSKCCDDTYIRTYEDDDLDYTYLLHSNRPGDLTHGPATVNSISNVLNLITGRPDEPDTYIMPLDWVFSVRCLTWPPQARRWPGRARPYGCPDHNTIDRIVADGCHLVPVAHRLCRDNEWMDNRQWRLSFSMAEIRLMGEWTPIQQLVYHVLRSVLKIAGITTESERTVVSNYHVKTVMMWAGELHPANWWNSADSCIVAAAARLLDALAGCLVQRHCLHYFVDAANLFTMTADQSRGADQLSNKLRSLADVDRLAPLLLAKYVLPGVLQVCPDDVVRLFYDRDNLNDALSAVVAWRCGALREKSWRSLDSCSHAIERCVAEISLTPRSCYYFMERLDDVEPRLVDHFVGVACLHVAYNLHAGNTRKRRRGDQLLDALMVIFSWPNVGSTWRRGNARPMAKAAAVLKSIARTSCRSVEQIIQVELSKAYLYSELNTESSSRSSFGVFSLANVYLAAMYYDEERYEIAVNHCRLSQQSAAHDHVVQAELLPDIDTVNTAVGISALYQFITDSALSRQPLQSAMLYIGVLSVDLFANFLHVLCLRHRTGSVDELPALSGQLQRYLRSLLDCRQPVVADILLFKLTTAALRVRSHFKLSDDLDVQHLPTLNSSELVGLLTQFAVERLTIFREVQMFDFGGDVVPSTTDFRAMYAFRRGLYADCMQLCQTNIENFADHALLQEIFMMPEFIFLLGDCDLVSVIGLALLIAPEARSRHQYQFAFRLSQLSAAFYLYTECQLRLQHSPTSLTETRLCADVVRRRHPPYAMLNTWTLLLIDRKITNYLRT